MSIGVITGPLFDAGYFHFLIPFGSFMVVLGYMMTSFSTHYSQIMLSHGLCVVIGFYLLPILNAASTFGRITPNFLADHVGPLNMLAPAASITALLAHCWIAVNLSTFYGFFSGSFVSLPPRRHDSFNQGSQRPGNSPRHVLCSSVVSIAG
ncbi:hypothetical protein J3F84DRAFT_400455 [Trichoderma pleuroticola]